MDKWNALPKDVQKVLDDLRVEQAKWTGNYMDDHVKTAVEWSKDTQNVEVIELTKEEKAAWNSKLEFLTSKWITDSSAKGFPAQAIVDDLKRMISEKAK